MTSAVVGAVAGEAEGVAAASRGGAAARSAAKAKPPTPRAPRSKGSNSPPPGKRPTRASGKGKGGKGNAAGLGYLAGSHKANKGTRSAIRGQRLLVVEFLLAVIVLGLSPLTDKHKTDTPAEWMKRATGICALFLILGMIGAAGPKAAKVAAGLGGIVCTTLLVTDRSIFNTVAARFGAPPPAGPAGPGEQPLLFAQQPGTSLPDAGTTPTPAAGSLPGTAVQPGRVISRGGPDRAAF